MIRLIRLRLVEYQPLLIEEIWLPPKRFDVLMDVKLTDYPTLLYPMYARRTGHRHRTRRARL